MRKCLRLGQIALERGNPPVGAILVWEGEVIGEGIESGKSTGDITNHAEILAVRDALAQNHRDKLSQATMYTTHEPCLMCSYLIRHHQIPRIIYGSAVEHIGGHTSRFDVLKTAQVPQWGETPEVEGGILKAACEELTRKFLHTLKT